MFSYWHLILVALALLIAFEAFCRFLNWHGTRMCVREILHPIRFSLERGMAGSRMWIKDTRSHLRVEFQKTIPQPGRARFVMEVDSRRCSPSQFRAAQESLASRGIVFTLARESHCGAGGADRIFVDCGPDEMKATRAAKAVLTMAFGLEEDSQVRACFSGRFDYHRMDRRFLVGWEDKEGEDRKRK